MQPVAPPAELIARQIVPHQKAQPAHQNQRADGQLFDAVTPRTAGFNSTDTAALSPGSLLLTIIFMFIGGSPGSTAGGVKTTTVR